MSGRSPQSGTPFAHADEMQDILGQTIHPGDVIAYAVRATWEATKILKVGTVKRFEGDRIFVQTLTRNLHTAVLQSSKNAVVLKRG